MKAIIWTRYGPPEVLQLQEVATPAPKASEILVRIHATTVTQGDCELRGLTLAPLFRLPIRLYTGLRKPQRVTILGQELAGTVEAVGKEVTRFQVGDSVFGATGFGMGAYAEFICLPEQSTDALLAIKPPNMSYEEAATLPTGGMNAVHFLRKGKVRRGDRVLINGAGGSIGTYAVQIAKVLGAEVTAVDSAPKLAMLRALGADHFIDYTREDFTQNGETYDVVVDVVGKSPFARTLKSLRPQGRYMLGNLTLTGMIRGPWASRTTGKQVILESASYRPEDLRFLVELIEAGTMKAVIDRRYPLQEMVEAHRYVESGQKQGSVVIAVA